LAYALVVSFYACVRVALRERTARGPGAGTPHSLNMLSAAEGTSCERASERDCSFSAPHTGILCGRLLAPTDESATRYRWYTYLYRCQVGRRSQQVYKQRAPRAWSGGSRSETVWGGVRPRRQPGLARPRPTPGEAMTSGRGQLAAGAAAAHRMEICTSAQSRPCVVYACMLRAVAVGLMHAPPMISIAQGRVYRSLMHAPPMKTGRRPSLYSCHNMPYKLVPKLYWTVQYTVQGRPE
jgi:hypothetical protein